MVNYHMVVTVRGNKDKPDVAVKHIGTDERRAMEIAADVRDDVDEVHVHSRPKPDKILRPRKPEPAPAPARKAAKKPAKKAENGGGESDPLG
jgi:hypothetical protein